MNNTHKEALIADYLAGQEVSAELLQACHDDVKLADELAGHLEVERLLRLTAAMENGELFVKEVTTRLQCEGDEGFVGAVAQQIQQSQKTSIFRGWKYAAAALVVLSLSGWFLCPC
jgi:precorrin-4 methylase